MRCEQGHPATLLQLRCMKCDSWVYPENTARGWLTAAAWGAAAFVASVAGIILIFTFMPSETTDPTGSLSETLAHPARLLFPWFGAVMSLFTVAFRAPRQPEWVGNWIAWLGVGLFAVIPIFLLSHLL